MKITIDTFNKTLEVLGQCSIKELEEFVYKYKLEDHIIQGTVAELKLDFPYYKHNRESRIQLILQEK